MAANIEIVPAAAWHVRRVAKLMRDADRAEVLSASGRSPVQALCFSLRKSTVAWTALIDGKPEVIFGVADLNVLAGIAAPWLLGTDAIMVHRSAFLRGSVEWRGKLLSRYAVLKNLVDDRNAVSMRWLKWLGFKLSSPVPLGQDGAAFRLFELRREDV